MRRIFFVLPVILALSACNWPSGDAQPNPQQQHNDVAHYVAKPGQPPPKQYESHPENRLIKRTPLQVPAAVSLSMIDVAQGQTALIKADPRCNPYVNATLEAGRNGTSDPNVAARFQFILGQAEANSCLKPPVKVAETPAK